MTTLSRLCLIVLLCAAADHAYVWLAGGVGQVKSDEAPFGGDGWSELLSATVGGIPYP